MKMMKFWDLTVKVLTAPIKMITRKLEPVLGNTWEFVAYQHSKKTLGVVACLYIWAGYKILVG